MSQFIYTMKILSSRIDRFQKTIREFSRRAGRESLPWRRASITAYEVWISEIMLQQTQVSRVIGYYERFIERFPTVDELARSTWEEFLPYYVGLGYYARGRNMLKTAQMVTDTYAGKFPRDKRPLMKLPGVGEYTASAILSFAHGDNYLAWDTNLKRVIGRFFFGTRNVFDGITGRKNMKVVEIQLTGKKKMLNAALMDFGSALCTSRPKCANCPLAKQCLYFQEAGKKEHSGQILVGAQQTRRSKKVDWSQARVFVWLHENHQQYYSSRKAQFRPFVVPVAYNSRAGIKQWFREKYGLELSVRPPRDKVFVAGQPTLFVNAQILSGRPVFATFAPERVREYNKNMRITRD